MSVESGAGAGSVGAFSLEALIPKADELAALPRHPETFTFQDIPDYATPAIKALRDTAAIRVVDHVGRDGCGGVRQVYQFHPHASEFLDSIIEQRDAFCPCGHAGLRNCGDHYECGFDACAREFTRDELEGSA